MDAKEMTRTELQGFFSPLPARVNKGDMGRVLAICGSYDPCGLSMSGAACFAASAAYRSGAGIVEIFTPRENYPSLASSVPEAIFSLYGYEENTEAVVSRLLASLAKADAVICGCGLGKSPVAAALVKTVLQNVTVPLVLDADGLNLLSEQPIWWSLLSENQRKRTVITPHPGEMSRLCGRSVSEILADTVGTAARFAREKGVVCLLKDHNTVITDGETVYINQTGNPGMATAGMGDLLAGIMGAMAARYDRTGAFSVLAAAAAYLHGRAGDLSAAKSGQYSLTASSLLHEIPAAVSEIFAKM